MIQEIRKSVKNKIDETDEFIKSAETIQFIKSTDEVDKRTGMYYFFIILFLINILYKNYLIKNNKKFLKLINFYSIIIIIII